MMLLEPAPRPRSRSDADIAVDALPVEALLVDALVVDTDVVTTSGALEARVVEVAAEPAASPDQDPERHLRVAPDSYRRRRHVRIAAAAAAVAISATLFAVVGFNVELAQHQIQLQALQKQLQTEQTRYYDLRAQVAERSSPPQIVSKARALGLVTAPSTYLVASGITPPPSDPTGTAKVQKRSLLQTEGSLDPPTP